MPLKESIEVYFTREVLPHVPGAWVDSTKTKVGYEIPLNRHFYRYEPPRPLEEIESDIKTLESEILIAAARLGYETVAVPIACVYFGGRASHFHAVRDTLRIARLVARTLLAARMAPRGLWRRLTERPHVLAATPATTPATTRGVSGHSRLRQG